MSYPSYLLHYGIVGQKWGVRRFQNEDGTLTPEGIRRYSNLIDKSERSEKDKQKLSKFEDKLDVAGRYNHPSEYASRKERIRASKRFDKDINEKMLNFANDAADRRQRGNNPMHYVKKYTETSLERAVKFVNGDQSEAAQKIIQHHMNQTMNGLNYILWEIGDFNSYLDHPSKYNQIDYSYNVKNKKLSQKKWSKYD